MKFIYPAVFKKTEDGRYKGTFPDLEGCFGEGDTLDEAIESANAAAFDWISVELSEEVPELPPITDPDDMELEDEDVVRNIQVNIRLYDGMVNEVYRECLKCPLTFQTSLTYLISPKWGGKASPLILSLYLVRTFSVTKYFCFILPASSLPLQWTDREHNMESM